MPEQTDWPEWWDWPLVVTSHVRRRMVDRGFSETDLRQMLADARDLVPDDEPGRAAVLTEREGDRWQVIVEPNPITERLVVVTAYPVE